MISDSLALPRLKPEKVIFEETYFARLQEMNMDCKFVQMFIGGATLPFLYKKSTYYTAFCPDIVIVQSGVVDCALRAFGEYELLFLRKWGIKIPKRFLPTLRKYRNKRYTNPRAFKTAVRNMQKRFGKDKLYWISIMPACEEWEKVVPGITKSVEKYNTILKNEVGERLIAQDAKKEWMMSDFHHLNEEGHKQVFLRLNKVLSNEKEMMKSNF